jgi:hypothetical protein
MCEKASQSISRNHVPEAVHRVGRVIARREGDVSPVSFNLYFRFMDPLGEMSDIDRHTRVSKRVDYTIAGLGHAASGGRIILGEP